MTTQLPSRSGSCPFALPPTLAPYENDWQDTLSSSLYPTNKSSALPLSPRLPRLARAHRQQPTPPHPIPSQPTSSHPTPPHPQLFASLQAFVRSVASFKMLVARGNTAPLLPTVLNNLGNVLLDQQRPAEAHAHYVHAAALEPPVCLVFNGLSNALEGLGRFNEAVAACKRGVHRLPSCDLAYYNLGRLLRSAERNEEAPLAYRVAVALSPREPRYINGLGTAMHGAGRVVEAGAAYHLAAQLAPEWSAPCRNLGLLDFEAKRLRKALIWFRKTVTIEPMSAETYTDMGTAYLELGDQMAVRL